MCTAPWTLTNIQWNKCVLVRRRFRWCRRVLPISASCTIFCAVHTSVTVGIHTHIIMNTLPLQGHDQLPDKTRIDSETSTCLKGYSPQEPGHKSIIITVAFIVNKQGSLLRENLHRVWQSLAWMQKNSWNLPYLPIVHNCLVLVPIQLLSTHHLIQGKSQLSQGDPIWTQFARESHTTLEHTLPYNGTQDLRLHTAQAYHHASYLLEIHGTLWMSLDHRVEPARIQPASSSYSIWPFAWRMNTILHSSTKLCGEWRLPPYQPCSMLENRVNFIMLCISILMIVPWHVLGSVQELRLKVRLSTIVPSTSLFYVIG